MNGRLEGANKPSPVMAGLVGEYPDLDILVNAAENGSVLGESSKGSDIEGAFDPEEYAELVQQCTEKSQSVQQHYNSHLEYQKQKLAQENEAALLEALQQSLTNIESDHFSDFVNLSSSLEQSSTISSDLLSTKNVYKKAEDSPQEEESVLKKLLLSSSNKEYPREGDSLCDGNNNKLVQPKQKEMPDVSMKQEKSKPKMTKKKPFTELLKHLEGAQSMHDQKSMPGLTSRTNQVKKVGTRLVNTVRYMQKYNTMPVARESSSFGKFTKVKMEVQSPEKIPARKTIFPPTNVVTVSSSPNLKRSASFQSFISPKVAKIVVAPTNCHTKNTFSFSKVTPSALQTGGNSPLINQPNVTTVPQEKNDMSTRVVKWEDYLNRVRSGIKSAPNSPTTSPRSVRGSARPVNNFMLLKVQERNLRGTTQAPVQPRMQTKLVPLPKPLCKTRTTRNNVQLQEFEEYLSRLSSNLTVTNSTQNSPKISITYVPSKRTQVINSNDIEDRVGHQTTSISQVPPIQTNVACQKVPNVHIVHVSRDSITPTFVVSNQASPFSTSSLRNTSTINTVAAGCSGSLAHSSNHLATIKETRAPPVPKSTDCTKIASCSVQDKDDNEERFSNNITAKPTISLANAEALRNDIETIHNYCTTGSRREVLGEEASGGSVCGRDNTDPVNAAQSGPVNAALSSLVAILNATQAHQCQKEGAKPNAAVTLAVPNTSTTSSFGSSHPRNSVATTIAQNVVIDGGTSPLSNPTKTVGSHGQKYQDQHDSEKCGLEPTDSSHQSPSVNLEKEDTETLRDVPSGPTTKLNVPQTLDEYSNTNLEAPSSKPENIQETVNSQDTSQKVDFKPSVDAIEPCTERESSNVPTSPKTEPPEPTNDSKSESAQAKFSMTRSMAAAEMLASDIVDDGVQEVLVYKGGSPKKPQAPALEDPDPAVILLDDAISSLENDSLLNGTEENLDNTENLSTATRLFCKLPSYFMTGKLDTEVARKKNLGSGNESNDEPIGYNKLPHYFSSGKRVHVPRQGKSRSPMINKGEPVVKLNPMCGGLASDKEIFYSRLPSYYTYGRPHPELRTFNDSVADEKDDTVTTEQIEKSMREAKQAELEASRKRSSKREKEEDPTESPRGILYSKLPSYYMADRTFSGLRRYNEDSDSYSDHSPGSSHRSRRRSRRRRKRSCNHRSRSHHRKRSPSRSRSRSSSSEEDSTRRRHYRSRKEEGHGNHAMHRKKGAKREQIRHHQAMEERRVVYVGRINRSTTKQDLRLKFIRFGNIESVSLHFREEADNYGFITFQYAGDAFRAIEEGNEGRSPHEEFELCFGGRRQFCGAAYQDLDGKMAEKSENKSDDDDFDALLRRARRGLR